MSWKTFIAGFLWGTAVSTGNYCYLRWVIKRSEKEEQTPDARLLAVVNCYLVRYFINLAALLAVMRWGMWAVAGTGLGLTLMKVVMSVRELRVGLRQSREAKRKRESNKRNPLFDHNPYK